MFKAQDRLAGAPLRDERGAQRSRQQAAGQRRGQQNLSLRREEVAARRFAKLVALVLKLHRPRSATPGQQRPPFRGRRSPCAHPWWDNRL